MIMWGVLPLVVGAATLVTSFVAVFRRPSAGQIMISVGLLAAIGWAAWILKRIMEGAWPTYFPHLVIGWSIPIAIGQLLLSRRSHSG